MAGMDLLTASDGYRKIDFKTAMRAMRWFLFALTATAGACVHPSPDSSGKRSGSGSGSSVDLEVDTLGPAPVLIAYRNLDEAWQVPPAVPNKPGHYTLSVAHVYQYLVVCADGSSFDAELSGATDEDDPQQYAYCTTSFPTQSYVTVSGTTVQAATVTMGGAMATTTAGGGFSLQMLAGQNDLIAFDATSIMIERNQTIKGPISLGSLDLAAHGKPLQPLTLSISNTDSGFSGPDFLWMTPNNDIAFWNGSGSQLPVPPTTMLEEDDTAQVDVNDDNPDGSNSRDVRYTYGVPFVPPLALPNEIENPTFDTSTPAITGAWTQIPPSMGMWFNVGVSAVQQSTSVYATSNWLEAMNASEVTFDISPAPSGYQSSWQVPPTAPVFVFLQAFTMASSTTLASTMYRTQLNGAVGRTSEPLGVAALRSRPWVAARSARRQAGSNP
jgi:hypothetical protein